MKDERGSIAEAINSGVNYKIDKILGDTLISKIDANKIIMFIKEKW